MEIEFRIFALLFVTGLCNPVQRSRCSVSRFHYLLVDKPSWWRNNERRKPQSADRSSRELPLNTATGRRSNWRYWCFWFRWNYSKYAIEVKDKDFHDQDVLHAISKFRKANLSSSLFIYGKNVTFDKDSVYQALKKIGREGHYCCLISILDYAKMRISDLKTIKIRDFVDGLLAFSKIINAKDNTIDAIKKISTQIFD